MIDFFAGVLIASLAGMGIGGGGLLVLYLVFVKGAEQLGAQGLNLVFFICAAASSLVYHAKKRKIMWRVAGILALAGTVGAYMGSVAASAVKPETLRSIFGWFIMTAGAVVVLNFKKK